MVNCLIQLVFDQTKLTYMYGELFDSTSFWPD